MKRLASRVVSITIMVMLLYACSGTPVIQEVPVPYYLPGITDTIELKQDTLYLPSDSNAYWEGNVEDSLKNVIGWMKVYYNRKIAELKLNPKLDTLYIPVKETKYLMLATFLERMISTFFSAMPFYWQILLIILLLGLLFVVYKLWNNKNASNIFR